MEKRNQILPEDSKDNKKEAINEIKAFSQQDISQLVIDTSRGHTNTDVDLENKVPSADNFKQLAKMNLETSQNLIILSLMKVPNDKILDIMEEHFLKPQIEEKVNKANAKIDPDKISHKVKNQIKKMGME